MTPSNFNKKNFFAGFTLLEMVVSIGIFSVLLIAAIGVIISISNAQTKAANIQNIQDNIRFTVELMSREMRTGTGFVVSSCTGNACGQINFTTANNEARGYCVQNGAVMRLSGTNICSLGSLLTAQNVVVDRLYFYVSGAATGPSDGEPRVTITMKIHSQDPRLQLASSMDLQTTIVSRKRDF